MSTVTTAIEMRGLILKRGPIMHLPVAPGYKASVTLFGQDRRKEKKVEEDEE